MSDTNDLLTGYRQIADFLGWTPRAVRHRAATKELPVFKMGRIPCATRSGLRAYLAKLETQAQAFAKAS